MRTTSILGALLLLACEGAAPLTDAGSMGTDAGTPVPALPSSLGPSERPAALVAPGAHDGETPLPVVVLLHGYGATGLAQDTYLGVSRETRRRGLYLIIPDGTIDSLGNHFWNATPACCDIDGSGVDDAAYLMGIVDELESMAPVSDVFFMGHSNGGFMSFRMACDQADRVSAIASLAGSSFATEAECAATRPVSVLAIHGDADTSVLYAGDPAGEYPSAPDVVARWAARAGCSDTPEVGEPLDLDSSIAGAETTVERFVSGCTGAQAELWTIAGGTHIPIPARGFPVLVLDWLTAHAR